MDWKLAKENHAGIRTWVKIDAEGVIHVRKTQKVSDTLTLNNEQAADFRGWHGKDDGIVARVPQTVIWEWQQRGMIDAKLQDQAQMTKILNDSDYSRLRTGGGRL